MALEDDLRRILASGDMTSLSVSRTGGRWQANCRRGTTSAYTHTVEDDPVDAVRVALGLVSSLELRARKPPAPDDSDEDIFG